MADAKYSAGKRYGYLRRLTTEQLEELLGDAPLAPDNQQTSDFYDAIEEVILERETTSPTGRLSDIDSAWAEFQQQYMAPDGKGQRLYPDEERSDIRTKTERGTVSNVHSVFRKAGLVAAVIAALLACMVAAQAAGLDVFGALARWTNENFRFETDSDAVTEQTAFVSSENELYRAIQTEVDKLDISIPVVPACFPEGYQLQDIALHENGRNQTLQCICANENGEILILLIIKYREGENVNALVFEKDESPVTEYIANGKLFYIMSNLETKTAAWSDGHLCITINGHLEEDELKTIVDSIGG